MMACSDLVLNHLVVFLLSTAVVSSTPSFLQNRTTPGLEWKMVGYLNMSDPTQRCPDSWQNITSTNISACGKKSPAARCDSLKISTYGASYQTVCGWFRGYEIGSPDGFAGIVDSIESYYVDGVTVTYGRPGNRHHVYTYAAGAFESRVEATSCPCAGGVTPPSFVSSDYYCESGNSGTNYIGTQVYSSDVLWDGQQCGGYESTCCTSPNLPWFCKTFPTPISQDLEVRICSDEGFNNENMAVESFGLYIQGEVNCNAVLIQF